jgi:hypothetical protein
LNVELSGFVVSACVALVALASLYISNKVYVDSTSPEVIIYLEQNRDEPYIIDLIIENIGKAAATDVKFAPSKPLPYHAWNSEKIKVMDEGPIIKGIPFFAPKSRRAFQFGNFAGIHKYFGDETIEIKITCKSKHRAIFGYKSVTTVSYLDIFSFAGIDASDNSSLKKVAQELGNISKTLQNISKQTRG